MNIPIEPVKVFVAGRGLVTVAEVRVTVRQFELGAVLRATYELLTTDAKDSQNPRITAIASGIAELTPEQFANWGADDTYAAECIVKNAGLEPAIKAVS